MGLAAFYRRNNTKGTVPVEHEKSR